ncbi:MAG: hypothetical protein OXI03_06365 [Chloroflexota bacterium]|nr:hypothetical protein [Chloroflexota bacterium]
MTETADYDSILARLASGAASARQIAGERGDPREAIRALRRLRERGMVEREDPGAVYLTPLSWRWTLTPEGAAAFADGGPV